MIKIKPISDITGRSGNVFAPVDVHKLKKTKVISGFNEITLANLDTENRIFDKSKQATGSALDFNTWLKPASIPYEISSDISDYLIIPNLVCVTMLLNRNGFGFTTSDLTSFDTDAGKLRYKTVAGKAMHDNHQNNTVDKLAIGVVLDSFLRPMGPEYPPDMYKLIFLNAIDRSKYTDIARDHDNGKRNAFSMGAELKGYTCSACSRLVGQCSHIDPAERVVFRQTSSNQLVGKLGFGTNFFENSSVNVPAYPYAHNGIEHMLKIRS